MLNSSKYKGFLYWHIYILNFLCLEDIFETLKIENENDKSILFLYQNYLLE